MTKKISLSTCSVKIYKEISCSKICHLLCSNWGFSRLVFSLVKITPLHLSMKKKCKIIHNIIKTASLGECIPPPIIHKKENLDYFLFESRRRSRSLSESNKIKVRARSLFYFFHEIPTSSIYQIAGQTNDHENNTSLVDVRSCCMIRNSRNSHMTNHISC